MPTNAYKIPSAWNERERLRKKGQFWTPDWIAEAMVEYVLCKSNETLFDPAVGAGSFFRAAKSIAKEKGICVTLTGMEIDPIVLEEALDTGLTRADISGVSIGDYVFQPPETKTSSVVANPPYIRHHRISADKKLLLKQIGLRILGKTLDGRAGLHVYFLITALVSLKKEGRLAFILPADIFEGKYSEDLWRWISTNYAIDAVVTFAPEASPFPNVDTNPVIVFIRKAPTLEKLLWAKCYKPNSSILKLWVRYGFTAQHTNELTVASRELAEGLSTGLSRPFSSSSTCKYTLGDFAKIIRGVATGANDYFFMTAQQVKQRGIPERYFIRAIGRTRDVCGDAINLETLEMLDAKGRPTYLLALNNESADTFPENLQAYLKEGEQMGLHQRPLISQRKPWYKTEQRVIPPFLFTYLGRRDSRFIRNYAKVIPLTGFLCVYPKENDVAYINTLWEILNHEDTLINLASIGKSYGSGAIKVEPRALEKLPIPEILVDKFGAPMQMRLLEEKHPYL